MPKRAHRKTVKTKNPAAVALGRLGGLKGGKARTAKMSSEERSALARKAVKARFARLTPKQRSEVARKAVVARWRKVNDLKKE